MSTVVATAVMTTEKLAARNPKIRRVDDMLTLLREWERMGIFERVGDLWRLTDFARRKYGRALAGLEAP